MHGMWREESIPGEMERVQIREEERKERNAQRKRKREEERGRKKGTEGRN